MAVYRQNPTKPVTFIDHTGISFTKFIAGTSGPELSPDIGFDLPCGVGWGCFAGATISGGNATLATNSQFISTQMTAEVPGDMVEFLIDIVSGGSRIFFGNGIITEGDNLPVGLNKFRAILPANGGDDIFYMSSVDATPVVYNSCSMKKITGGSLIETATGTITTFENSPTNILNYTGMVWAAPVVGGETVQINYNGAGNYTDNSFVPDPAVPMAAQITTLINCLDITAPSGALIETGTGFFLIETGTGNYIVESP